MELKKAITTAQWECGVLKQKNVAQIIERKKNVRESWGEKGKNGKWKHEMWAMVTVSLCNRRDKQHERWSDETAHIEAVKGNKSRVAANPSVAESLP